MRFKNIKILILVSALFMQPLSSRAIDHGYDGYAPLFVTITTNWCYACKYLDPIIDELQDEYGGRITFLKLDASSEDSVRISQQIARDYGIGDFFNANRYAFPRVAVYCPGSSSPSQNILGAEKRELYEGVLNTLLSDASNSCYFNGRPTLTDNGPTRPEEPLESSADGRPEIPVLTDRPKEGSSSGRPDELSFWIVGQPIPYYAYHQYLSLPKCSGNNQILCTNVTILQGTDQGSSNNQPVFSPWTPNATRNEKGFDTLVKKG